MAAFTVEAMIGKAGTGGAEANMLATIVLSLCSLLTVRRRARATSVSMSIHASSSNSGSFIPTSNVISSVSPLLADLSKSMMIKRPPSTAANPSCSSSGSPGIPPGAAMIRRSASEWHPCGSSLRTQQTPVTPEISAILRPFTNRLRCLSTTTCHFGRLVSSVASPLVKDLAGVLGSPVDMAGVLVAFDGVVGLLAPLDAVLAAAEDPG